jgi:hypothetical protein
MNEHSARVAVEFLRVDLPSAVVPDDYLQFFPMPVLPHSISSPSLEQGSVRCRCFFVFAACIFAAHRCSDDGPVDRFLEWPPV